MRTVVPPGTVRATHRQKALLVVTPGTITVRGGARCRFGRRDMARKLKAHTSLKALTGDINNHDNDDNAIAIMIQ